MALPANRINRFKQRLFRTRPEDTLPLHIEHQRIYILPTGRGWAFLLVLLIMLVASINYSLSLGYALSFLLTGLFTATLLHTYRNLAGLSLLQIDTGTSFCGEALPFKLHLQNTSRSDRSGIRVNTASHDAGIDISAGDYASVDLLLSTQKRGSQALGRLTLRSDFPLGLWTTWSYIHTSAEGLVFPQPEANPPPLPVDSSDAKAMAMRHASQGDVAGLRNYQPGDPLASIAWKTAARGQGLHVRTFEDTDGGSNTRLTLTSTAETSLEAQLSRLTAWVLHAEAAQHDYSVEIPDHAQAYAHGPAQRFAALTAFAMFRSTV